VKDENMTMTFTDKKARLSNYARLRFSNQGLRDRSSLPLSNSLSGKVGISDAKDEDGCLEPGARMRPVTSRYDSRKKNEGNFEKNDVQRFHFLWLWSCKILYNESTNHISFQCSTRQTA
jgi:hypothetical protein